jgi:hypothetical protein
MHSGVAVYFRVGMGSRRLEPGNPAFRYGLPVRGDGRPTRDAGPGAKSAEKGLAGAVIEVRWLRDVSWQKQIRGTRPK